jgi:glyoxylase-like metal-dependent hydrolase (beta-lactamase superfamily II)
LPSHNTLFVGDALATKAVTTGVVGPRLAPFTADPAEALASLARLERIDEAVAFLDTVRHGPMASRRPSVGSEPRGSRAAAARPPAIRALHESRCAGHEGNVGSRLEG